MEITSITEKSYNEVPYTSNAYRISLPLRQKSILKLLSFDTPPLENARVLEIGCSFGGNILSFAMAFPNSECIGIDLSETQIREGNKIIEQLGIKNLKLYAKNILDYNNEFGKFDYIVVHGVFSWIPDIVKEKILEVIHNGLVENGSANISYNTYPGWKKHEVIRDLMRFRLDYLKEKGIDIPEDELVNYANGTLEFLKKYGVDKLYYKEIAEVVLKNQPYYIRHEHLEENNDPMYLIDFEEMANKYGLSHICDSNISVTFPMLKEDILKAINLESAGNTVIKEQYYDYLTNKQFRSSFITHSFNKEKINIDVNFNVASLRELFIALEEKLVKKDDKYIISGVEYNEDFRPLFDYLNNEYPNNVQVSKIAEVLKDNYSGTDLYSKILELIYYKLVSISPIEIRNDNIDINKPKIKEIYRNYFKYKGTNDKTLINCGDIYGRVLAFSKQEAFIFQFFDGSRTLDELSTYLIQKANEVSDTDIKFNNETLRRDLELLAIHCYNHMILE